MWRADRDERSHARGEPEMRQRVARVEPAEAVRDDVDARVIERADPVDELLGPLGHTRAARQAHRMRVTTERVEMRGDAAKIMYARAGYADAIEAEQPVHEDHRQRRAARGRTLD